MMHVIQVFAYKLDQCHAVKRYSNIVGARGDGVMLMFVLFLTIYASEFMYFAHYLFL